MTIVLDGSSGITTPDVTSSGSLNIDASAPDDSVVVDASGNVGIGTSSPTRKLTIAGTGSFSSTTAPSIRFDDTASGRPAIVDFDSSQNLNLWASTDTGAIRFITNTSAGSERARITSGGQFLVGTTSPAQTISTNNVLTLKSSGTSAVWGVGPTTSFGTFYITTSGVGVSLANGATSWGTVSDERKKDIIEPIVDAAQKVASLRAVIGKYKTDAGDIRRSFLIAQDVQAVLPEAIDVGEDEDKTLAIKYTEVIPLLVASIQEQQAIIDEQKTALEALTARVSALEATNV